MVDANTIMGGKRPYGSLRARTSTRPPLKLPLRPASNGRLLDAAYIR